jgi:hypothetical protein
MNDTANMIDPARQEFDLQTLEQLRQIELEATEAEGLALELSEQLKEAKKTLKDLAEKMRTHLTLRDAEWAEEHGEEA